MALPLRVPSVEMISLPSAFLCLVRDAAMALDGGGQRAEKTNTGFAPLISFLVAGVEARFQPAGAQCS